MIAKSRQELAVLSAERVLTANLRTKLEAHLSILNGKERREIRNVKRLKAQLSEVQAQLEGSQSE